MKISSLLIPSFTTHEKLSSRFIGSRLLSSFKLSRGVLVRAYSGCVRVNVHWTTLWIRKSPQGHLCLRDCSMIARRLLDVCVGSRELSSHRWCLRICSPVRLVLRYSDRDLQFRVLRNSVRVAPRGWTPLFSGALPS